MGSANPRLLVVDDNESNRDMLSRRLVRKGFDIETAVDGAQALEMIQAQDFDLVLLDMMMPGLSGADVLDRVREDHSASTLPIIVVTAERGRKSVVKALNHGANDHISKPVDYETLIARINAQLDRRKAEAALAELNRNLEERVAERTASLKTAVSSLNAEIEVRNRAESALRKNQIRTNAILNYTQNAVLVTDLEGRIESINRAGEKMFGRGLAQLLSRDIVELFENGETILGTKEKRSANALKAGLRRELNATHPDGTVFPAEIVVNLMESDDGEALLFVVSDISERLHAEQKLRQSELQHRQLIERFPIPLFVHIDGKVAFANDGAAVLAGYEISEDIIGRNAMDAVHPDDRDIIKEMHMQSLEENAPVRFVVHRNVKLDGSAYWCESTVMPCEWGGMKASIVAAVDITERKEIEDRFRLLANNSSDLITLRDLDANYLYVSPSVERQLGYTQEEFIALEFSDFVHPEDTANSFSTYRKSLLESAKPTVIERRLMTKSGEYKNFESIAQPLVDEAGDISGIVSVSRDVTERKVAEEARAGLEKQIRQSQKIESLGTLAGGIAHEFNNILMVVSGYIRRALQDEKLSENTRESLDEAGDAAARAASITKKLLVFSGKHTQETGVIDLGELLKNAESMLVPLIGEQIKLMLEVKRDSFRIKADADQLQQAIVNLVINASHAMAGSGWVTLGADIVELEESLETASGGVAEPGKYVSFFVEDQGCGMDEELIGKIFDPFFTTKGPGAGTGLGLAVIYGFVQESNGVIDVESTVGEGTRFTLYFPLSEEALSLQRVVDHNIPKGAGELVMVVEDEEALRTLLVGDLESLGYEIVSAGDGIEAMEIEADLEKPIQLLLSDVRMPGFSGPETAAALSTSQPDMKVIFMSGYAPDDAEGRTQVPEDAPFVSKPVDLATLANKMRETLES